MKQKSNKGLIVIIIILIIALLGLVGYIVYNEEKYIAHDKEKINLDVSINEKKEYIMLEGEPVEIITKEYVSSLGYSLRYDVDIFTISKKGNNDIYELSNKAYFTVERNLTASYEEITKDLTEGLEEIINGNLVTFVEEVTGTMSTPSTPTTGLIVHKYYIKSIDGYYLITATIPNDAGYYEGALGRMTYAIKTFEIS